jgi:hypothetical protein
VPAPSAIRIHRDAGAIPGRPRILAHTFDPFWQADPGSPASGGSSRRERAVARQLARPPGYRGGPAVGGRH